MTSDDPTATTDSVLTDAEKLALSDIFADVAAQAAAGNPPTEAEQAKLIDDFFAKGDTTEA